MVVNFGVFFTIFVPLVDFYLYMQSSSFPTGFKEKKLGGVFDVAKRLIEKSHKV